ncbi:MAG TPA: hypothetical protein VNO52_16320, partial [Methylomirabilota bacterium]|nr:hypothetical protein [Methylomirabilota bacterium]
WRSEIFGHRTLTVPPRVIWKRLLEHEQKTTFEIRRGNVNLGHCRWTTTIDTRPLEVPAGSAGAEVEGMAAERMGYTVELEGTFNLEAGHKLRFDATLKLRSEREWERLVLKLSLRPQGREGRAGTNPGDLTPRPQSWEVHAEADSGQIRLLTDGEAGRQERIIRREDLQDPSRLLRQLAGPWGPWLPGLLATMGFDLSMPSLSQAAGSLQWEAWTDSFPLRNAQLSVYRIEGRFLDYAQAVLFVRRDGGEILRVELPGDLVLVNSTLSPF